MTTTTVLPGQPLSDTSGTSYKAGKGTFERGNGQIFSSLAGVLQRDGGVLSVKGHSESTSVVPQEGSTVVGTVQKISKTQATLLIQTSDGKLVNGEFQGLIRSQDVRQTEQDKVQIYNCFRPRDVVRAAVISLGDARSYYLSTAANDLGVVFAVSSDGEQLKPVSWEAMRTEGGLEEPRKVAGPSKS